MTSAFVFSLKCIYEELSYENSWISRHLTWKATLLSLKTHPSVFTGKIFRDWCHLFCLTSSWKITMATINLNGKMWFIECTCVRTSTSDSELSESTIRVATPATIGITHCSVVSILNDDMGMRYAHVFVPFHI